MREPLSQLWLFYAQGEQRWGLFCAHAPKSTANGSANGIDVEAAPAKLTNGHAVVHVNGMTNGEHQAGVANGYANGAVANGHANGVV